jgi:hypothetical protein
VVAIQNRADSGRRDQVEVGSWCPKTGATRWRVVLLDSELWIDARMIQKPMPWPFDSCGFDMNKDLISEILIDEDGVLMPAGDFAADEESLQAMYELFALVVATTGEPL